MNITIVPQPSRSINTPTIYPYELIITDTPPTQSENDTIIICCHNFEKETFDVSEQFINKDHTISWPKQAFFIKYATKKLISHITSQEFPELENDVFDLVKTHKPHENIRKLLTLVCQMVHCSMQLNQYKHIHQKILPQYTQFIFENIRVLREGQSEAWLQGSTLQHRISDFIENTLVPEGQKIHFYSFNKINKAAASQGRAVQSFTNALPMIFRESFIPITVKSNNGVLILENWGTVFKMLSPKSKEEEQFTSYLMEWSSPGSISPFFRIKDPKPSRFGIEPFSKEELTNAQAIHDLDMDFLCEKFQLLSNMDQNIAMKAVQAVEQENKKFQISKIADPYVSDNRSPWFYKNHETWVKTDFISLKKLWLSGKLPPDTFITTSIESLNIQTIEHHALKDSPIFKALSTIEKKALFPESPFLLPENACIKSLEEQDDSTNNESESEYPEEQAKLILPSIVYQARTDKQTFKVLKDAFVKPFIEGMFILDEVITEKSFLNKALHQVTKESEVTACAYAESMPWDCHGSNLGIRLERSSLIEKWCNYDYSFCIQNSESSEDYNSLTVDIDELARFYLQNIISDTTPIQMIHKQTGESQAVYLGAAQDLINAIVSSQWQLCFFDNDQTGAESANFQKLRFNSSNFGHLIPLRSCLLLTSFKDKPLQTDTIQQLVHRVHDIDNLISWLWNFTSPLYEFFPEKERKEIQTLIQSMSQNIELSLSYERTHSHPEATLDSIRKKFAKSLSHFSQDNEEFWQKIESSLQKKPDGWFKPHIFKSNDSLANIAKTYNLSLQELFYMNEHNQNPIPGSHIHVRIPFIKPSNSKLRITCKAARKRFASQLFPKNTAFFIKEYLGIRARTQNYLENFLKLESLNPKVSDIPSLLQHELKTNVFPLLDNEKQEILWYSTSLEEQNLNELWNVFLQKIRPTYLNYCKVIYPYFAEAWEIMRFIDEEKAGFWMGNYAYPLELFIHEAMAKANFLQQTAPSPKNIQIFQIAQALQNQLASLPSHPPYISFLADNKKTQSQVLSRAHFTLYFHSSLILQATTAHLSPVFAKSY